MAAFIVEDDVSSLRRATFRLTRVSHSTFNQSNAIVITYHHHARTVTVKNITSEEEMEPIAQVGEGIFVRSRCSHLPAETSTGFSTVNFALMASVINRAAEFLVSSRLSLLPPVSVDSMFIRTSSHANLLKIVIADTGVRSTALNRSVVALTELDLYESLNTVSGTIFCFMRTPIVYDGSVTRLMARNTGDEFTIPRRLAHKLRLIYGLPNQSNLISVSAIPRPLLFLLRYNFEQDLEYRAQYLRDLMVSSAVFVLSVLEWLVYYWVEDVGLWGCRILGLKVNSAYTQGLENVALTLGMI